MGVGDIDDDESNGGDGNWWRRREVCEPARKQCLTYNICLIDFYKFEKWKTRDETRQNFLDLGFVEGLGKKEYAWSLTELNWFKKFYEKVLMRWWFRPGWEVKGNIKSKSIVKVSRKATDVNSNQMLNTSVDMQVNIMRQLKDKAFLNSHRMSFMNTAN